MIVNDNFLFNNAKFGWNFDSFVLFNSMFFGSGKHDNFQYTKPIGANRIAPTLNTWEAY